MNHIIMVKLTINEIDYYAHPIYDANAGSADGNVINICEKKLLKGNKSYSGYSYVSVSKYSIFGPSESRGLVNLSIVSFGNVSMMP